jgi:hypothetical protein
MRSIVTRCSFVATIAVAGLLGVGLPGCTPDYADQQALTRLVFNGITGASGGAFQSAEGVTSETFNFISDEVTVSIANLPVTPKVAGRPIYDVLIEGYTVEFRRTDRGTVVPQSFSVTYTQRIPVGGTAEVTLRLLSALQKGAPPLSDLNIFGAEQSTGFPWIQTIATVRIFGRNLIGDPLDLAFPIEVTFCRQCKVE